MRHVANFSKVHFNTNSSYRTKWEFQVPNQHANSSTEMFPILNWLNFYMTYINPSNMLRLYVFRSSMECTAWRRTTYSPWPSLGAWVFLDVYCRFLYWRWRNKDNSPIQRQHPAVLLTVLGTKLQWRSGGHSRFPCHRLPIMSSNFYSLIKYNWLWTTDLLGSHKDCLFGAFPGKASLIALRFPRQEG